MKVKNIIFDWSGTLSDDFKLSHFSTQATLLHFGGKKISLENYRRHFVLPARYFYEEYIPKADYDEINKFYFDHFTPVVAKAKLFNGVRAILKKAKGLNIRLYVFSTVRQEILNQLCRAHGITPYFKELKGDIHDKERELPDFCRRHGLKAKETLYVGDTDHDILAAKRTKTLSGAFLCGYHLPEKLLKQAPDFVWNDHAGMLKFLSCLSSPSGREVRAPRTSGAQRVPAFWAGGEGKPRVIPTVGALIFNKGEIFLMQTHKWGHTFGIPGGKIKYGEASVAALKREIREETNLKLRNIRWAMIHDSIRSAEFYKKGSHFLLLNYYAESLSRAFRLNNEAESGFWIRPELALNLRLNEPTRVLIEHYLKK